MAAPPIPPTAAVRTASLEQSSRRVHSVSGDGSDPLLRVNNIEVVYDHVILVLKGVSLEVPQGGIVALLGANGAGKSTTLRAISGLTGLTSGEIRYDGHRIDGLAPEKIVG
ncbi:MAG: ATP-binding cassette domain-containing protein, partial [SAR324 cluster bacterium]|nr:ATP-binding cassette domain-containing protein [SAR324 cluster bacterium]